MSDYRIYIRPAALQEIKHLPGYMKQRVKRSIEELVHNPSPSDSKRLNLSGHNAYRLRLDKWRILYVVREENQISEGYSVSRDPDRLPFPLRGYVPDLIVSKNGGGFIIEVKNKSSGISIETVKRLAEEVATHESWRFLLVTLDDIGDTSPKNSEYVNVCWNQIGSRLKKVQQILDLEIFDAAILYLWTVFEIMMRKRTFDLKLQ